MVVKLGDFSKTFYTSLKTWTASVCIPTLSAFAFLDVGSVPHTTGHDRSRGAREFREDHKLLEKA